MAHFQHNASGNEDEQSPPWLIALVRLNAASFAIGLGLLVAYIRHLAKNSKLSSNTKLLWVVVLIVLPPFSMAAYWYLQL